MRLRLLLILCGVFSEIKGCFCDCLSNYYGSKTADVTNAKQPPEAVLERAEALGTVQDSGEAHHIPGPEKVPEVKCDIGIKDYGYSVSFCPTVDGKGFANFHDFIKSAPKQLVVNLLREIINYGHDRYNNNHWIGWASKEVAGISEKNELGDYGWCSTEESFALYIQPCAKRDKIPGYAEPEQYQEENYYDDLLKGKKKGRFVDTSNPNFVTMVNAKEFWSRSIFWRGKYTTIWSWMQHGTKTDDDIYDFMDYLGRMMKGFYEKHGVWPAFWMNVNGYQSVGHAHCQIDYPHPITDNTPDGQKLFNRIKDQKERFKFYNSEDGNQCYETELSYLDSVKKKI